MKAIKKHLIVKRELSGPQKGVHFSEFSSGDLAVNNISVAFYFHKPVSIDHFSQAVNQALISFPTLRMRLSCESLTARQYLVPYAPVSYGAFYKFSDERTLDSWLQKIATEKVPYWDSPLADFHPFQLGDALLGFVFRAHHIIADAWTYQLVTEEIFENLEKPYPSPLSRERKGSYFDFLKNEKIYLSSERCEKDREFWADTLLPLPDRTGMFVSSHPQSFKAERNNFALSGNLSDRIDHFCDKNRITPSLFFLWILAMTIFLRTGKMDFLLGMLTHNRVGKSEKRTAGMFISTIALKISLNVDYSQQMILKEIHKSIAASMRHQRYPVSSMPIENTGKESLFSYIEVVYSYNSVHYPFDSRFLFCGAENFPLLFRPYKGSDGRYAVDMDFRIDSINRDEIKIFNELYLTVLNLSLEKKERMLKDTPLVSRQMREKVLTEFNQAVLAREETILIHSILEKQAETTPDAIALSCKDQTLSYEELNRKSNQVARKLLNEYGGGEKLVGLLLDRSPELIILLYGILKAGFAYIPLDKNHPVERNRSILDEAAPTALFCDDPNLSKVYTNCLFINEWDFSEEVEENLNLDLAPRNLAYIIFTSGSTGKPKGVMVEHGAVVNRLYWMKDFYDLKGNDCFIQKTPYTFDVSVPELFGWPMGGGRLHVLDPNGEKDPSAIAAAIERYSVTIIHFVPSMLGLFLDYLEAIHGKAVLDSVRITVCSGEVLKGETASRFFGFFEKREIRLLNLYGPTEAAVEVTAYDCQKDFRSSIPIGRPIDNVQILILSSLGEILPPGIKGELCISGTCLARGYFNSPELTDKYFVSHEHAYEGRLYRSGDLASWTEDGEIFFHGRMDDQVKIRGNRIELGEIEAVLSCHQALSQSVVIVQKDKKGHDVLACHYVTVSPCSSDELRLHLADRVPPYMIPRLWMERDSLPLTSSGKIDRKAIESITGIRNKKSPSATHVFSIESAIRDAWETVLPESSFSDDDDFFALGGDSFGLITIFASLEKRFHVTLQELFDHSSINELAAYIIENKTLTLTLPKKNMKIWDEVSEMAKERKRLHEYEQNQFYLYYSTFAQNKSFESILLTGGTGFFGIHLAQTILEKSDSILILLVRCGSEMTARERFISLWNHYFPERHLKEWEDRLIFLCGDLSIERFGLDEGRWESLSRSIDTIIHAGANVRHYGRYEEFVGTNIRSTETLLDLMRIGREKEFHYISTISLHLLKRNGGLGYFYESDFPEEPHLENNYLESKWEAERILRRSGMNVRYYRLGNLVAQSEMGISQINRFDNAFLRSLDTYRKIGAVPELDEEFIDLTYVDQAVEAVWLLMKTNPPLRCYHILNNRRISLKYLASALGLSVVNIGDFLDRYSEEADLFTFAPYLRYPELLLSYAKSDQTDVILKKLGHNWMNPEKKHLLALDGSFTLK